MPGNRHVPFLGEGTAVTLFPLTRLAGQRARSHHTHLPFQGPVGHSLAKHGGVLVGRPGRDSRTCECAGLPAPLRYPRSWSVSARTCCRSTPRADCLLGGVGSGAGGARTPVIYHRESQPIAVCRPVMKCGQEIRQGGELAIEPVWLLRKNSVCDDIAQRLSTAVLLNQQAVQPAVAAEWTYDVVRVSYQSITAH